MKLRKFLVKLTALVGFSAFVFLSSSVVQKSDDFEILKNLEIFVNVFKELNINYVDPIQPGELIKVAIDEMLSELDPYTVFIPESEIEDLRLMTTGQYGGIGALIQQREDYVVISEPYENFPAQKSGLRAGDIILEINGESAKGKKVSDVSTILKGYPGTKVTIKIERPFENKQYTFELTRQDIKISNVPYYDVLRDNVGYIKLTNFTLGAANEVRNAFFELKNKADLQGLILDLRGNGGGLLNEAINLVGLFVPRNTLVVTTKGKLKDAYKEYRTSNQPITTELPLVVLIDGSSASASEIVAGALQDMDRAVIIGKQSFGKGLVQNIIPLPYNTRLKVTIARYYIPSGRCIQSIDYSKKDTTKSPKEKQLFYTRNKRPVYDAGGIIPDIQTDTITLAPITMSLIRKHLIFDFATFFHQNNPSIDDPQSFTITDAIYQNFLDFIKDKDYDYETESEKLLTQLRQATEKEKYYHNVATEFESLAKKIQHNKEVDVLTFRDQISLFLGDEIVARYYYQKGRVAYYLKYDKDVDTALAVLTSINRYKNILSGKK